MHPEIAKTLIAQRRDELVRHTTSGRRNWPPPVPAVARQLDPDRAGPGRRPAGRAATAPAMLAGAVRPW